MSKYNHHRFDDWRDVAHNGVGKFMVLDVKITVYQYRGNGAATEPNIVDELQNWIDSNEKICALTIITPRKPPNPDLELE